MKSRVSAWNFLRASVMSVAVLVAFLIQNNVHAQTVNICSRTQQVETAILTAINAMDGVTEDVTCSAVTDTQLAAIIELDLNFESINSLRSGDFDGLIGLQTLDLSDNNLEELPGDIFAGLINSSLDTPSSALTTLNLSLNFLEDLPAGIFSGLANLTGVDVSSNAFSGDGTLLTVTPVVTEEPDATGQGMVALEVAQGVPFSANVIATVSITGGTFPDSTTSVTISTGNTQSDPFPFTLTDISGTIAITAITSPASASIDDDFSSGTGYSGFAALASENLLIGDGICNRTLAIQTAILDAITPTDCAMVTNADLSGITELNFSDDGIAFLILSSGDFAGLTGLQTLNLSNINLGRLPVDIFAGLGNLQSLDLSSTGLIGPIEDGRLGPALPATIFTDLGNLQSLILNGNSNIRMLPAGIFNTLTNLLTLELSGVGLQTLDATIFNSLTMLQTLNLSGNFLAMLEENTFASLNALTTLNLSSNSLTMLEENTFASLTALTTLNLGSNNLMVLPPGIFSGVGNVDFSGLTALQTLDLSNNDLRELPDGIFSGLISLTGVDVSDNPATGDSLTLTLTLRQVSLNELAVEVVQGVPFEVTATVSITGGTVATSTVTIAKGSTQSNAFTVTVDAATSSATISIDTPVSNPLNILNGITNGDSGYEGFRLASGPGLTVQAGICDRTQAIYEAIVARINAATPSPGVMCNTVTDAQLLTITSLDLSTQSITNLTLELGDFDLLTGLTTLNLSDTGLSTLPEGIFSGLSALTTLNLSDNAFTVLPDGIFSDLDAALTTLDVSGNPGAPFTLTPTLTLITDVIVQSYTLAVEIPQGVPFDTTATVSIDGSMTPFMIATGNTQTSSFAYSGDQGTITVAIATSTPLTGYTGLTLSNAVEFYPICHRTPQVESAILQVIDDLGGTLCEQVTVAQLENITELDLSGIRGLLSVDFAGLTALTSLDLSGNELTTSGLPADIFNGLGMLQTLNLSNNNLEELPAGIFSNLTTLIGVDVSDNPDAGDTLALTVTSRILESPSGNTPGTAVIEVVEGVPFTSLTATVEIMGGALSGTSTVIIPKGEITSAQFQYTEDNDPDTDTRITVSNLMSDPDEIATGFIPATGMGYSGFQLDSDEEVPVMGSVNICGRTDQVETAILTRLGLPDDNMACMTVPSDDLAGITMLNLSDSTTTDDTDDITTLLSGDFAGLSELITLNLSDNRLTTSGLPADIFAGLSNLQALLLNGNLPLTELPAGIFNGLTSLTILRLQFNQLTPSGLPATIFADLTILETLDLRNNALGELPATIFDGLSNLRTLDLSSNALEELPATIFDGLSNLRTLNLSSNALEELPATIFDGLEMLQGVNVSGNMPPNATLFTLTVAPRIIRAPSGNTPGEAVIEVVQGVPFTSVTATVSITGGTFLNNTSTVTLSTGATQSASFAYTATDLSTVITVNEITNPMNSNINNDFDGSTGYSGFRLVGGSDTVGEGICSRTDQVEAAIVAAINAATPSPGVMCNTVTQTQLQGITILNLNDLTPNDDMDDIMSLMSGDFAGLSGLQILNLSDNMLESLPEGVFVGLTALETLDLSDNDLMSLREGVFSDLMTLETLRLNGNDLTMLPAGVFAGLTSLTGVDVSGNPNDDSPAFTLTLVLRREMGMNSFVIEVAEGAPTELTADITVDGGMASSMIATIETGMLESDAITVTLAEESTEMTVRVTLTNPMPDLSSSANYSGLVIGASPDPLTFTFEGEDPEDSEERIVEERIERAGDNILPTVGRELISEVQRVIGARIGKTIDNPCHQFVDRRSRRTIKLFRLIDVRRSDVRQSPQPRTKFRSHGNASPRNLFRSVY